MNIPNRTGCDPLDRELKRRPFLKSLMLSLVAPSLADAHVSMDAIGSRQVALWLDTTGIDPEEGHRVLELGLVELERKRFTGQSFHAYINPERGVEDGANAVHGIDSGFVAGMPTFKEIASTVSAFISGTQLIVVTTKFSVGFLDHEFAQLHMPSVEGLVNSIVSTWQMAKDRWPTEKNDLDSVSERLGVPVTDRDALATAIQVARTYVQLLHSEEGSHG